MPLTVKTIAGTGVNLVTCTMATILGRCSFLAATNANLKINTLYRVVM